jgi:aminodeoxyfutalosine synthase
MSLILNNIKDNQLSIISDKVMNNERITPADAMALYESSDILTIGALADLSRRNRLNDTEKDYVYFINNHHINLTNICEGTCKFCAYKKSPDDKESFFLGLDQVEDYVKNNVDKTVKELHIVSALNEKASLEYYINLFLICKQYLPEAHIQALTAVEIDYLSRLENLPPKEILKRLTIAGLGSLPGGGAEIFNETIRTTVCPDKISADRWLEIMNTAHVNGVPSNATMLSGIGENYNHRVEHMERIRKLQDETGGFMTFIPLVCHYENTELSFSANNTGIDNLKDLAIARIFLDNIPHIKAFWIQLGVKMAQISLAFGVDDLDGTVVKERISRAAGASESNLLTVERMIELIRNAGKIPVERDTIYNIIKVHS